MHDGASSETIDSPIVTFFFFFLIKIQIIEIPWKRVLSRSVSIETFPGRQARDSVYVY